MQKLLYIILCILFFNSPVLAGELYYCGGYNSSYTYDAKIFEQQFLKKTPQQACTFTTNTGGIDPICIEMYNRNVADYKSGRCKLISEQTYKQLKQAQIQRNRQLFYQIRNSGK